MYLRNVVKGGKGKSQREFRKTQWVTSRLTRQYLKMMCLESPNVIPFSFGLGAHTILQISWITAGGRLKEGPTRANASAYSVPSSAFGRLGAGSSSELEEEEPDESATRPSGARGPPGKPVLHTESNSSSAGSNSP